MLFVRSTFGTTRHRAVIFRFPLTSFVLAAALVFVDAAAASDQTVTDLGDNGGANQLRAKLSACLSSGGGTISFTVAGTITLTAGALPVITNPSPDGSISLTIDGKNGVTISGLGIASTQSRILTIASSANVTLKNIILTNANYAFDDGGAINNRGNLVINNCKFVGNVTSTTFSGGAILTYGPLTISDTEFSGNKGGGGGAVYPRFAAATTTITRCNFHDNEAINTSGGGLGGAILVWDGPTVTIDDSTFTNNKAVKNGGAIHVLANSTVNATRTIFNGNSLTGGFGGQGGGISSVGTLNLTNVTLNGNFVPNGGLGGGIYNNSTATLIDVTLNDNHIDHGGTGGGIYNDSTCNLTNVTLSGNSVPDQYPQWGGIGGGIYSASGSLNLTNVTLSGNRTGHSPGSGSGGIYLSSTTAGTFKNTVIAHGADGENCGGVGAGTITGSSNLSDDGTCGFGAGRDNVPNLNLGPLAYNGGFTATHLPLAGSAVIDNGTPTGAPLFDQRGFFRAGAAPDVGAVEANGIELRIISITRDNSDISITFQGVGGQSFRVERSQVLPASSWQPLIDLTPSTTGLVRITDFGAVSLGHAFYRVHTPP